jgi:hypothetical protein
MAKTINKDKKISKKDIKQIIEESIAYGIGVGQKSPDNIDTKTLHKLIGKGLKYIKKSKAYPYGKNAI